MIGRPVQLVDAWWTSHRDRHRGKGAPKARNPCLSQRALFRTRTGDPFLTMEVLYQLS